MQSTLTQLQKAAPGIEVRIRFFATAVDCRAEIRGRLDKPEDVEHLLHDVPRAPPENGFTHLFEAITKCVGKIREENKQRQFEWVLFGVFSDGEDQGSPTNYKTDYVAQIDGLRKEVPAFEKLVFAVGKDAQFAAGKGDYGPLQVKDIGSSIPVPPKPKPRYSIALAPQQADVVNIETVATTGAYRLPVSVTVNDNSQLADLAATVTLGPNTPFAVQERSVTFDKAGKAAIRLQVPADTDVDRGVSVSMRLEMSAGQAGLAEVSGNPTATFSFKADKTLPYEQWRMTHASFVPRDEKTVFKADVGAAKDPVWTFRCQSDPKLIKEETEFAAVTSFDRAGIWDVDFSCTSESGRPYKQKASPIEVVDADFRIDIESANVPVGKGTKARIVAIPGADSKAEYTATVDGQSVPVVNGGIVIAPELLPVIGRHTLNVAAKSITGGIPWKHDAEITVTVAPQIGVIPTDFVEGSERITFDVKVSGDLGGKVAVYIDGEKVDDYPIVYPTEPRPTKQMQIPVSLPASRVKGREATIEVRPADASACLPDKSSLHGTAADIYAQLKQPTDGASITTDTDTTIVLEPAGDHKHSVGEVEFVVAFTQGDAKPSPEGPRATRANGWKVTLPTNRFKTGSLNVWARPKGGRLREDIFPEGKEYRKIGTLKVSPPHVDFVKVDGERPDDMTAMPGKPLGLKIAGVDLGRVESVRWRYGPLLNDTDLSAEQVKEGPVDDAAILITTPKAWGSLPVELTVKLRDGAMLDPVKKSVAVTGDSPSATPSATPRSVVIGAKSLRYKPGLTGDFREAVARLFAKGAKPDDKPLWESAPMHGDPGELHVDLPQVSFERVKHGLELKLAIDSYPGDPNPWREAAPVLVPVYPKPLVHWWLLCVAPLVASCAVLWRYLLRNEPYRWSIDYSFKAPKRKPNAVADSYDYEIEICEPDRDPPEGCRTVYHGWNRWQKEAYVPLWLFAKNADNPSAGRWLLDPQRADQTLKIQRPWDNPFKNLPFPPTNTTLESDEGQDYEEGTECYSKEWVLYPQPDDHGGTSVPLRLRMRCPPGGDPYLWVGWTWTFISTAIAMLLSIPFHCWPF